MANRIYQNPNQFLTQPNQLSPDPNQFSQIAKRHAKQLSRPSHPNRHAIPCKPFSNRCRTRPGIRKPGQPAPIFSNCGYNSLLSCGRLVHQWRLARATSQDRLPQFWPQKCVMQAAVLPQNLGQKCIIQAAVVWLSVRRGGGKHNANHKRTN